MQNNRRKIELMNSLLFSLPGTPVLYYGDEIGMGDNIYLGDRNGVRTPMQWSSDRNAGFSRSNPQRLYLPAVVDPEYHYEAINVEAQQANPSSLLWWTKRLIALRKRFRAFGRGTLEFLYPDNRKVLAFLRCFEDETILVVANLSRFSQYARLDLSRYQEHVPTELFGLVDFPRITAEPYLLTLGPTSFFWFHLRRKDGHSVAAEAAASPRATLRVTRGWDRMLDEGAELNALLPRFMKQQRWYQGKARGVRNICIADVVPVPIPGETHRLSLVRVDYVEGESELYVLPLAAGEGEAAARLAADSPQLVLADLEGAGSQKGILHDAVGSAAFRSALLGLVRGRRRLKGDIGELQGEPFTGLRRVVETLGDHDSMLLGREQSNTSIVYGRQLVLKLYRRLESGVSLDLELGRFLTEHGFAHTPAVLGAIEYRTEQGPPRTVAIVQEYVANQGDAWSLALDAVAQFQEAAGAIPRSAPRVDTSTGALLALAARPAESAAEELIGTMFLEESRLLGQRTAELHSTLAGDPGDADFAPEPFTLFYQRSLYQSMRNLAGRTLQQLGSSLARLPESQLQAGAALLHREADIMARFKRVIVHRVGGLRIRCHGDYHLGQVLYTGNDFIITDFEGEPLRPLSERRLKRSPLRDVAGMIRSFHYAAYAALLERTEAERVAAPGQQQRDAWARYWYAHSTASFLRGYFAAAASAPFITADRKELGELLDAYLLEKALYELGYEMNNRPHWTAIPLRGITDLLEHDS